MKTGWIGACKGWLAAAAWVSTAGLMAPGLAWSQSAESVGINYPNSLRVGGAPLVLNGSGVNYRGMTKQYTVALYAPQKSDQVDTVLGGFNAPLQLRFVMLQSMRVDDLGMVIMRGIEANSSRDVFFKLIPSISAMGDIFAHIKRLEPGDTFAIEYLPKRGTVFLVNEQPVGMPIAEAAFFPALTRVWLGKKPVTQDLKDALLDFRPPPVLEALR
ncbi:MAG TPA: chalcone isomerase family protein [Aquabacterium sp.]|nr:chalcone isomerase family protein [Aquabacterium sp.]